MLFSGKNQNKIYAGKEHLPFRYFVF